jgi:poly(A) polymerase Pap1
VEDKTAVMSNESQPPSADFRRIHTTTFYIGLAIEPRAPGDTAPRKLDISWPTSEFTKMCKQWEKFNEKTMGICVKYIKRYFLKGSCAMLTV